MGVGVGRAHLNCRKLMYARMSSEVSPMTMTCSRGSSRTCRWSWGLTTRTVVCTHHVSKHRTTHAQWSSSHRPGNLAMHGEIETDLLLDLETVPSGCACPTTGVTQPLHAYKQQPKP